LAKSVKDGVLEALKKGDLTPFQISNRIKLPLRYVTWELSLLEEEGLAEYDFTKEKWHLKRR